VLQHFFDLMPAVGLPAKRPYITLWSRGEGLMWLPVPANCLGNGNIKN